MKDPLIDLKLNTVKSAHGVQFGELRTIINMHDPIGLIEIGAPEDEYDPEVKTIIVQLENGMTVQQIHDLIYKEFLRWFGDKTTVGPKEVYVTLASDIHVWISKT